MSRWLEHHQAAEADLHRVASNLRDIAVGLRLAGIHDGLANRLFDIADDTNDATARASDSVSDALTEMVNSGREQLYTAMLAAIKIATEGDADGNARG